MQDDDAVYPEPDLEQATGGEGWTSTDDVAPAVAFVLAEYAYLTSAILLYRRLESFLVAGTGIIFTGAVGAFAAIEAANKDTQHSVEATLLAAAAWGPTLMLLAEMTALSRIRRISTYLARQLQPFACRLAGTEVLGWEPAPSARLLLALQEAKPKTIWTLRLAGSQITVSRKEAAATFFLSSAPLIVIHSSVTVVFSVFACLLHPIAVIIAPSGVGVFIHLLIGRFAYLASRRHESRLREPRPVGASAQA